MQKVLYVYGGPDFHPTEAAGQVLAGILAADGRFVLEMTADLDAFAMLPGSEYAAVVVYTTGFSDDLTPAREQGLLDFVRQGGGFVGLHSAADSFRGSRAYVEMLNGEFLTHPYPHYAFPVTMVNHEHYITTRLPDFTEFDEMYHLQSFDPAKVTVLAETTWQGQRMPMAYVRDYGQGRVAYLANGHTMQVWQHPAFRKMVLRAIAWGAGANLPARTIHCGILGYGPSFNMGKGHASWINDTPGMQVVAVCDAVPARVAAAREELPGLPGYFTDLDAMLAMPDLDLAINILPHNLHASTTLRCLEAGKHVVLEKPFSITVEEANAMVDKARETGQMLSLFHNRRWDGDFLAIQDIVKRGLIGDIFHIECQQATYGHPGFWWRSDRTVSGGIMYDWGAHFIDWILNLVPGKVTQVMGDLQKRVWDNVSNEDHGQVYLRFENGVTAEYLVSSIAALAGPKWRILGTKGAIEADWTGEQIHLVSVASGVRQDSIVKLTPGGLVCAPYYNNIADHLLLGEELLVTAEQSRRVIGVIDAGRRSAELRVSVAMAEGIEEALEAVR